MQLANVIARQLLVCRCCTTLATRSLAPCLYSVVGCFVTLSIACCSSSQATNDARCSYSQRGLTVLGRCYRGRTSCPVRWTWSARGVPRGCTGRSGSCTAGRPCRRGTHPPCTPATHGPPSGPPLDNPQMSTFQRKTDHSGHLWTILGPMDY